MRLLRIEEEDEKRKAQVEFEERRAKVVRAAEAWVFLMQMDGFTRFDSLSLLAGFGGR